MKKRNLIFAIITPIIILGIVISTMFIVNATNKKFYKLKNYLRQDGVYVFYLDYDEEYVPNDNHGKMYIEDYEVVKYSSKDEKLWNVKYYYITLYYDKNLNYGEAGFLDRWFRR